MLIIPSEDKIHADVIARYYLFILIEFARFESYSQVKHFYHLSYSLLSCVNHQTVFLILC